VQTPEKEFVPDQKRGGTHINPFLQGQSKASSTDVPTGEERLTSENPKIE
jgi:hypothetical protein